MFNLRLLQSIGVVLIGLSIASCGGGGGSGGATTTPPSSTVLKAGVSIGDNGSLCLNTNTSAVPATASCPALGALSYSLTITHSSFGLEGQTLTGTFTDSGDGSYHIVGTTYGSIFVYPNYSILTLKLDPANPIYANYFSLNPHLTTATYIPIFAVNASSLLSTTDQVTSNAASLDYREVSMGMSVIGGNTSYLSEASHGTVSKVSDTVFTVGYCSNNGNSANNGNLANTNCNSLTFTYNAASSSWLVTPVDPAHSSQVTHAYFVQDVMSNSVVGYIDTSDATKTSSKFAYVTFVPRDTKVPTSSSGGTATFTGYQLCSSDGNCARTGSEQGIYYTNAMSLTPTTTAPVTAPATGWNAGCNVTQTDDYYANGFTANFFTPGTGPCTAAGYRPDTIGFFMGQRVVNGKGVALTGLAGYDSTVSPSQKITIGFIKIN